jgi:hypothetical protein
LTKGFDKYRETHQISKRLRIELEQLLLEHVDLTINFDRILVMLQLVSHAALVHWRNSSARATVGRVLSLGHVALSMNEVTGSNIDLCFIEELHQ